MTTIGEILARREKYQLAKSERAELIKQFYEGIKPTWDEKKYKPLKPAYIAFRLSHIKKKSDLYYFLARCKEAKSFSKYFFWALKPQDTPKQESLLPVDKSVV